VVVASVVVASVVVAASVVAAAVAGVVSEAGASVGTVSQAASEAAKATARIAVIIFFICIKPFVFIYFNIFITVCQAVLQKIIINFRF
jgi:hypothetical protein